MEIKDIKTKKSELENDINKLADNFMRETNIQISEINIAMMVEVGNNNNIVFCDTTVKCEI